VTYLVIDLRVKKASMLQSIDFITPAPVFAAVMAAHALDMEMGKRGSALGVSGVGLVHQHCQPWLEHLENKKGWMERHLVQRRGACSIENPKNKEPQSNPLQPDALTDLEWTLVLDCAANLGDAASREIEGQLMRMRLAGGVIALARVRAHSQWDDVLQGMKSGFWIDDASALLEAEADPDPFIALIQAARSGAWVVPVNLGYALLEAPAQGRSGSRDAKPHAFAEHMIGLIRYTPARLAKVGLLPDKLWRHGWDGDQFLVTNRSGVILSAAYKLVNACASSDHQAK